MKHLLQTIFGSSVAVGLAIVFCLVLVASKSLRGDTLVNVFVQVRGANGCSYSDSSSGQCMVNLNTPLGTRSGESAAGSASAAASYGVLHSASSAVANCSVNPPDAVNCYNPYAVISSAAASFSDIFQIYNAPESGSLSFNIETDGYAKIDSTGQYANYGLGGTQTDLHTPGASAYDSSSGRYTYTPERYFQIAPTGGTTTLNYSFVSFLNGTVNLPIEISLLTYTVCGFANNTTCAASADFYNTATVTSLQILDANGQAYSGASVRAVSGTDYNSLATPVPEPSSLALLGSGLVLGCAFVWRRIKFESV